MAGYSGRPGISTGLDKKETALIAILHGYGRVLVAYSGGTDSTLLLYEAVRALGPENVKAATAVGDLYPRHESSRAKALCKRFSVEHHLIETAPFRNRALCQNDEERCYHCKKRLLAQLGKLAKRLEIKKVLDASQMDDRADYRPGARAVTEFGAMRPLLEAGLDKSDVRRLSRYHGLPTADLPAAACLASRVPYGTSLTKGLLDRIARGEEAVRRLGFHQFRLRHHGDTARLEFDPGEMERAFRFRRALAARIEALGWTYATLDLRGYRQGSLNETIGKNRPRDDAGKGSSRER